ncbi:MAG: hypothetical protein ACI4EW_05600 [Butyrivibrio sp.]
MKQALRIGGLQIQNNFHSVKYWMAILLQAAHAVFYSVKMKDFSLGMGEPANVFDGYFLTTGSEYVITISFLIFLFMVSDIPFVNKITAQERIRTSKEQWVRGKIFSIPVSAVIMQITIILMSVIILSANGFCQNIWSRPFYQTAVNGGAGTLQYPGKDVLSLLRPFTAVLIQAVLIVLFETTQAVLLYILCLKFNKVISYAVIMVIHIAGFFMNAYCRVQFLPFPHTVMASMYSGDGNGSTYLNAFIYYAVFLVIEFICIEILIRRSKTNDLV